MLTSMTGFGRSLVDAPAGRLIVEIQSVNRKYLEISVRCPRSLAALNPEFANGFRKLPSRGDRSRSHPFRPNCQCDRRTFARCKSIEAAESGLGEDRQELGYDPKTIDLPFLMERIPNRETGRARRKKILPFCAACVDEAVQRLSPNEKSGRESACQRISRPR